MVVTSTSQVELDTKDIIENIACVVKIIDNINISISPTKVANVKVNLPKLDIIGRYERNTKEVTIVLKNISSIDIDSFTLDISSLCPDRVITENPYVDIIMNTLLVSTLDTRIFPGKVVEIKANILETNSLGPYSITCSFRSRSGPIIVREIILLVISPFFRDITLF